jgi:uncharacterized repeat protein (TIGR01451 family)
MKANDSTRRPARRAPRGGLLAALSITCLALANGAGMASAAAGPTPVGSGPPGPQLSIAIGDGRTTTTVGNRLTYTITVENLGRTDVSGLTVTQTVPAGLELVSAESADAVQAGDISWNVNLEANATRVFHSTMTVVRTPPSLLRLASVACARAVGGARPIVCAIHSDQLPAGAAETMTGSAGSAARAGWWYFAGGLVMLSFGALIASLVRRRRPRQSS